MCSLQETVAAFGADRGLRVVETLASGLDFTAILLRSDEGREYVARCSATRVTSTVNDAEVNRLQLLNQEQLIVEHLTEHDFPAANVIELHSSGGADLLLSTFLPDDGSGADGAALGRLLARLHQLPPPEIELAANLGCEPTGVVIANRVRDRYRTLQRLTGLTDTRLPSTDQLMSLVDHKSVSLLHLDVRAANLRSVNRKHITLIDWGNALVGDPILELARLHEFSRLPENGLNVTTIFDGYGVSLLNLTGRPDYLLYRFDAAVMLALVFVSEAPHRHLGPFWTSRAHQLASELGSVVVTLS